MKTTRTASQTAVAFCHHKRPATELTVAIVDDDPAFGAALAALVDLVPELTVRCSATTVDAAIPMLQTTRVDLALIDVRMPDGGGLAVIEKLQGETRPRAIVLMSADPRPADVPSGVRFIDKAELELAFLQSLASQLRT